MDDKDLDFGSSIDLFFYYHFFINMLICFQVFIRYKTLYFCNF